MFEYIAEVEGPTSDSQVLMPDGILNTVSTLLDDQVYIFRVVGSNAVGNDSTTFRQICKYMIVYKATVYDCMYHDCIKGAITTYVELHRYYRCPNCDSMVTQ